MTLADDGEDHRNVPQYVHRFTFQFPNEGGLVAEKLLRASLSRAAPGHEAVRKARVKQLEHMQDHDMFESVWLGGRYQFDCATWLQDMKGDVVKARFVAQ